METVVVYKDSYEELVRSEFEARTELAKLKGTIDALANMIDNDPEFVSRHLKELSQIFK